MGAWLVMSWDFWTFPQASRINAQTGRWKDICWKSCDGTNTELTWTHRKQNGFMDSCQTTTFWNILWWPLIISQCSLSYLLSWMLSTWQLFFLVSVPSIDKRMIYPVRPLYCNTSNLRAFTFFYTWWSPRCFPMNKYMAQRFPKVWFWTLWFPALISNTMQHSFPLWLPLFRLKTVVTNCLVPIKRKRLETNFLSTWHPTPLLAVPQSVGAPSTLSAGYHKQLPLHFMSHANISETAAVRSVPWAVGDWRDVTEAF